MNVLRCSFNLALLTLLVAAGCGKEEKIRQYRAAKPHVVYAANHVESSRPSSQDALPPTGPPTHRMLAAFIPHEAQGWFFKVVGPKDAVAQHEQAFRSFVQSVTFSGDNPNRPAWKLPENWSSRPGSSMRFATIAIDAEPEPLEVSVIPLPMQGGATPEYVLLNVNRWRGQMALRDLALSELDENTESFETGGASGVFVDLLGHFGSGGMGAAPFASSGRAPFAGSSSSAAATGGPARGPLKFTVPEGWSAGETSVMRKAAFTVADGGQQAEITVIDLAASAGGLLANVNRWRGQIGLKDVSQAELDNQIKKISLGSVEGDYVALVGPQKSILGVIAKHGGKTWFIKLTGDAELAAREQDNFEAFVKSVRFDRT